MGNSSQIGASLAISAICLLLAISPVAASTTVYSTPAGSMFASASVTASVNMAASVNVTASVTSSASVASVSNFVASVAASVSGASASALNAVVTPALSTTTAATANTSNANATVYGKLNKLYVQVLDQGSRVIYSKIKNNSIQSTLCKMSFGLRL